jgi:hypothetical protein
MALATAERENWSAGHKHALAHLDDLGGMLDAMRKDIDTHMAASSKAAE